MKEGAKGTVSALVFSPNDQWIAAGHIDGSVELRRTDGNPSAPPCQMGPLPEKQKLGRAIKALVISPEGTLFAVAGRNGTLRSCSGAFKTGASPGPRTAPSAGPDLAGTLPSLFDQAAIDPAGKVLAVATDKALAIFTVDSGEQKWRKNSTVSSALQSLVTSMAMCPDGKRVATGFLDGGISLWEIESGKELRFPGHQSKPITSLVFSPDGTRLAASHQGISLWDTSSGKQSLVFPEQVAVSTLAFHPHGTFLASASEDSGIILWDAASGRPARSLRGNADWINGIAVNRQGTLLATASDDQHVRIWKKNTDAKPGPDWALACDLSPRRAGVAQAVAFNPVDGRHLAVASDSAHVRIYDADLCAEDALLETNLAGERPTESSQRWARSVAYSSDGRRLACGTDDGTVFVWDLSKKTPPSTVKKHGDVVRTIAFRQTDSLLASGSFDKTVRLWSVPYQTGENPFPEQLESVKSIDFSPNGTLLAMASANEVAVWALSHDAPKPLGKLVHDRTVSAVRFSPDGKQIGSASVDGYVRLWDASTRGMLSAFPVDEARSEVRSLEFSPTGGFLAAATLGRVIVWNAAEPTTPVQLWQGVHGWAFVTQAGEIHRSDNDVGGLLWSREGEQLTAVPPRQPKPPEVSLRIDKVTEGDDELLPKVTAHIQNSEGAGTAYWLTLEAVEYPGEHDLRDHLRMNPSAVFPKLDPGGFHDIVLPLSLRKHSFYSSRQIRFCLTVGHANDTQAVEPCKGERSKIVSLDLDPAWRRNLPQLLGIAVPSALLAAWLMQRARDHRLGFSHPVIHAVRVGENPLKEMALKSFPDAEGAFVRAEQSQSGLRRLALERAGIDDHGWQRALLALDSPQSCAGCFAESLRASLDESKAPFYRGSDVLAFKIALPALSIYVPADTVLIVCTATTMTPQNAVSRCTPEELKTPRFALLVDQSLAQPEVAEIKEALKDAHPATVFVIVNDVALRRILLSRDASQAKGFLRELIVQQCDLRQIVPYREGGNEIPADEESFFFGRKGELERMLQNHRHSFVLVGPRAMGKSSLLNALGRELVRRYPRVKVLKHQMFSGSLRSIQSVDPMLRADTPDAFYESVMQRTTEFQIFLLDEADKFVEQEKRQDYAFCNVMRALHGQGRASFVLAGHQELHDATRVPDHPLRNFGALLHLEPLDPSSAERMILDPLTALGVRFVAERQTVDWLREQTGCRPHLLALVCWAIVNLRKPPGAGAIPLNEIQSEVHSHRTMRAAFGGWENGQVRPIDRALMRVALLKDSPFPEDLQRDLSDRGVALTTQQIAQSLSRLYAWHYVLVADGQGRLQCPVPLFAHWISEPNPELPKGRCWNSREDRLNADLASDLEAIRQDSHPSSDSTEESA